MSNTASAQCTSSVGTYPATVNGVTITFSSNNASQPTNYSVTNTSNGCSAGNNVTTPANSQLYGGSQVTGTYTFSTPVNDIVFAIAGTNADPSFGAPENYAVSTNTGTPTIAFVGTSCFTSINGANIVATYSGNQVAGGGAYVSIHSATPYTTLTLNYTEGSQSGSTVAMCSASVIPAATAAATPVATGSNPTSPGTATGSVSLSASGGTPYAASTPVSVTYTANGSPVVFTGTTDATGKITIPNLPAGNYGPFSVSVNGGPASAAGGSVTLTDPAAFALNCAGRTVTGTLTQGTAASGVTISVPYTGGNGSAYGSISVASTGVTGLTASAPAGTVASGGSSGTITLTVSGTPSGNGTAAFALSIGGQSCSVSVPVNAASCAANAGTITRQ